MVSDAVNAVGFSTSGISASCSGSTEVEELKFELTVDRLGALCSELPNSAFGLELCPKMFPHLEQWNRGLSIPES